MPDPEPDALVIYTGPEADAVLARSHHRCQRVLCGIERLGPGEYPSGVFDIESLLQRTPSWPEVIPDVDVLEGYSTWENAGALCGRSGSRFSNCLLTLRV